MNGILPLWKPRGLTSHDCVQKVRRIFKTRKVGHTGTLDPEVEGVLVLCIGEETKLVQYLTKVKKTYIAKCTLGIATETEDQTGKIIEKVEINNFPKKEDIHQVLDKFQGEITQIPPMYSAVRVKGKRLYEYARNNETVERPKRKVNIHDIALESVDQENKSFTFQTTCSSGTYIRTLCVDIGKKLGLPAHMSNLVRIETSNFQEEDTISFEGLQDAAEKGTLQETLYTRARALKHFDGIDVNYEIMKKVSYGQKLKTPSREMATVPFKISYEGEVLALYKYDLENKELMRPERVFQFKIK